MHSLESHFPNCPYCGESIELLIDLSAGAQQYVEDCQVCCRPIIVVLAIGADGDGSVELRSEDD